MCLWYLHGYWKLTFNVGILDCIIYSSDSIQAFTVSRQLVCQMLKPHSFTLYEQIYGWVVSLVVRNQIYEEQYGWVIIV